MHSRLLNGSRSLHININFSRNLKSMPLTAAIITAIPLVMPSSPTIESSGSGSLHATRLHLNEYESLDESGTDLQTNRCQLNGRYYWCWFLDCWRRIRSNSSSSQPKSSNSRILEFSSIHSFVIHLQNSVPRSSPLLTVCKGGIIGDGSTK